jgi:hypothetical protein
LLSFAGFVPEAGQQRYRAWKAIRDKVGMLRDRMGSSIANFGSPPSDGEGRCD